MRNARLLSDLSHRASLLLLEPGPIGWQRRYVTRALEFDPSDTAAAIAAAGEIAGGLPVRGIVSYDEALLPLAAHLGEALGLPGLPRHGAAVVRDKHAQRVALAATASLQPTRSRLVVDPAAATAAAAEIGYPVVIKPRNLSGSLGVRIAGDPEELRRCFAQAAATDGRGLGPVAGTLVEEYLDGPELCIDCWVLDGAAMPLYSSLIVKGYAPHAINVGCIVGRGIAGDDVVAAVEAAACTAALACGLDRTIANVDLRWTGEPRVIEVNGRPGGELLGTLANLASGVRIGEALGDVALGRAPAPVPPPSRAAGIAFISPRETLRFAGLRLPEACREQDWLVELQAIPGVGERVVPPPEDPWGRAGWAIVTGPDADAVRERMDAVWAAAEVLGS